MPDQLRTARVRRVRLLQEVRGGERLHQLHGAAVRERGLSLRHGLQLRGSAVHLERLPPGDGLPPLTTRRTVEEVMMRQGTAIAAVLAVVLLGGCTAEEPTAPIPIKHDAAPPQLEAPRLAEDVPTRTPLKSVALRGRTAGTNLVVKGGVSPQVKSPLPSGDFCVDVPLPFGAATTLSLTALGDGLISPETRFTVTQDSTYPPPPNPYCDPPACGAAACPETETACDDGIDNDLNGWIDQCDLACSGCIDDFYAPNASPANVPILPLGKYDLKLCPCHADWLSFTLADNGHVDVTVTFVSSSINIDLKLFRAEDAEDGGYKSKTPVRSSTSDSGTESIYYTTSKAGTYYLWVYSRMPKQSGAYHLVSQ